MSELGGISFPIRTTYDGSGVQTFIADLAFARSAFRQFKDDLASGAGAASAFANSQRSTADSARAAQAAITKEIAALKALAAAQNAAATAKATSQTGIQSSVAPSAAIASNTKQASQNLREGAVQASLLNSTIVRMLVFRQIVQFIREGVGLFKEFVKSGVEYDATIEKTKLGIAGLLDSIAVIKDAQGNTLDGAEKFRASVELSADQMGILAKEALRTGVSVEELGKIFQQALGPGLQAGLKLDEVAKLTGEISIAATALGVSENRIAHELRDITTGHIRSATDRIGTALGINADDIKRAKEAGDLFGFLQQKLIGFNAIADEAPKTFDGIVSRLKVMGQIISGLAAQPLFENLKSAFQGLREALVDDRTIVAIRTIDDAVSRVVDKLRVAASSEGFGGFQRIASTIAIVIDTLSTALIAVVQGVTDAANDILTPFKIISSLLGDEFGPKAQEWLALLIRIGAVWFAIGKGVDLVTAGMRALKPIATGLLVIAQSTTGEYLILAAVLIGLVAAAVEAGNKLAGTNFKFITIMRALGSIVLDTGKLIVDSFKIAWDAVAGSAEFAFNKVKLSLVSLFSEIVSTLADVAARIPGAEEISGKLSGLSERLDVELGKIKAANEKGDPFAKLKTHIQELRDDFDHLTDKGLNDVLATADKDATAGDIGAAIGEKVRKGFNDIVGLLPADVRKALDKAEAGTKSQDSVTVQRRPLSDQQQETINKEREETKELDIQSAAIRQQAFDRRIGVSVSEQQITATRNEIAALNEKIKVQEASDKIARDKLKGTLATGNASEEDTRKALLAFDNEHTASLEVQRANVDAITEKLNEQTKRAGDNGPVAAFDQMAVDITSKVPNAIQAATQIASQTVTQFASFVSDSIIAAFDPNNKETLLQRFKQFLSSILKETIQMLTQIAITKAILGDPASNGGKAGGLVGLISSIAGAASAAQGGMIRSPAHYARGAGSYAAGGDVRPNWVDRRDTVAAWLQPGEFVHNLGAVRRYGLAVMDALNRGTANVGAVQAAVGIGSIGAAAAPPAGASLAGGGVASGVAGAQARINSTPTPAFIVADDHSVDALLQGGKSAVMRFFRENADSIDAAMRRTRPSR